VIKTPAFFTNIDIMQNININIAGPVTRAYSDFVAALMKKMPTKTEDLLHAAVGISGEAGELLDAVKKHWAYGKELDMDNVREELGDIMFYVTAMLNVLEIDEEEVVWANVEKLEARYPGIIYTDTAAIARADKSKEVV